MDIIPATFHSSKPEVLEGETLSVLEAARRAGVTQSAILRWIRNGYLAATPSPNGWQIPADQLDAAARAADEARGTGPVPRRTAPNLEPVPLPIRRSMETRAVETRPQLDAIGENIVSPLAELIRDQIDVVHDQAEVIGWLQAERARLVAELNELKSRVEPDHTPSEDIATPARSSELYDEVVSLLWKDSSNVAEAEDDPFTAESDAAGTNGLVAEDTPQSIIPWDFDDWFTDAPEEPVVPAAFEMSDPPALELEDFADPSWFFTSNDLQDFGEQAADPVPALKPIVPRSEVSGAATSESDEEHRLQQMIDETERKIAQLWQNEEQLRSLQPGDNAEENLAGSAYAVRESIWQRIWPRRR